MPDQLTDVTDETSGATAPPRPTPVLAALRQVLVVVAAFAGTGVLAGVLWEWIWTPPRGIAFNGEWRLDSEGLRADFSGTGTYVVVAAVAGLLLGALMARVFDRWELLTLVAVAAGAMLAAWLMLKVGVALGPPDPEPLARSTDDYTRIEGDLRVAGRSPYTALPAGALVGLIVVFLGLTGRRHDQG